MELYYSLQYLQNLVIWDSLKESNSWYFSVVAGDMDASKAWLDTPANGGAACVQYGPENYAQFPLPQ
jgi:hypothetical protein